MESASKKRQSETLKHRLEKRVRTEKIRFYFRLPAGEMLDGKTDCVLHARNVFQTKDKPSVKSESVLKFDVKCDKSYERNRAESGTLYVFKNFLCFKSSLPNLLSLVIPLRFVTHVEGKSICLLIGQIDCDNSHFLRISALIRNDNLT